MHIENDGRITPVQKKMCEILLREGWTEVSFVDSLEAHTEILKSVLKPGEGVNDPTAGLWKRQGDECRRRREIGKCISYVDLIAKAKKEIALSKIGD